MSVHKSRRELIGGHLAAMAGLTAYAQCACGEGDVSRSLRLSAEETRECETVPLAFGQKISCRHSDLKDGRLRECRATQNCVSSSAVRVPERYVPPWSYEGSFEDRQSDPRAAWNKLVQTVTFWPEATVKRVDDERLYLRAEVPSFIPGGYDDIEFLMKPDLKLCLASSRSRDTIFVFPFTTPLGDNDSNRKRLEEIRQVLGWPAVTTY
ncbi:unnamed protein product [Vitrella brassicaformis CCMP3155]|uniref:Uncharacterized protein n=1 Tax=Vitrella brassicaformis (strain CCMP3155) TaxID=1169540 RepID=A0A0G4E9X6_VITBC|nr:unnamed protein product [Vitrella brassicaformis CCMP3155]|eukprot:CEL91995.1 unnamed protein product [Vitrella brassicaformis CCMP3155]